jgi:hypothetical protein
VGNRVRFSVRLLVRKGGGPSLYDPDPDKPFKINRVPVNSNNCSGLASRTKRPAKLPVNSDWRMSRSLCDASKASCATRRGNLWARIWWRAIAPSRIAI